MDARGGHAREEGVPAQEPTKIASLPYLITWQLLRDLSKILTEND